MEWVEEIINDARRKGACRLADGVTEEKQLVNLLFSAQGREFCQLHSFPSRETWNEIEYNGLMDYNIYVNCGRFGLDISSIKDIAVIGDTMATLYIDGTECGHNIIVGHGAEVSIEASNYAVFEVFKIGQCKVEVTLDETAIQL